MSNDIKGILEALSDASPPHLALASFVLLPVVLDYWLQVMLKLFPAPSTCAKILSILIFLVIYIGCLIWMAKELSRKRELEVKRDLILGRLTSNDWNAVGFDSIKIAFGEEFTAEVIHNVIQSFPKALRYVRIRVKDDEGNPIKDKHKAGVGLVTRPLPTTQ